MDIKSKPIVSLEQIEVQMQKLGVLSRNSNNLFETYFFSSNDSTTHFTEKKETSIKGKLDIISIPPDKYPAIPPRKSINKVELNNISTEGEIPIVKYLCVSPNMVSLE